MIETRVHDPQARDDPAGFFGAMREVDPVAWSADWDGWVVTSYEHVSLALRERGLSSERLPRLPGDSDGARVLSLIEKWIVFMDPPDQTRLRRLVSKAFTPRAIAGIAASMPPLVSELLDAWEPGRPTDVLATLAFPFPARVISAMLEVPEEDIDQFGTLSDDVAELIHAGRRDPAVMIESFLELESYLRRHLELKKREPGDGLVSQLIAVEEGGDDLSADELIATCVMLLFAGHETTKNLIGNIFFLLGSDPSILDAIRGHADTMEPAVEEFLRYEGPAKATVRTVGPEPVELGGKTLEPGARVLLVLASANRDPRAFPDPESFRLDRERNPHLGFGHGIHYCLGAAIVRAEIRAVLDEVRGRFGEVEIAGPVEWQDRLVNRGLNTLEVVVR